MEAAALRRRDADCGGGQNSTLGADEVLEHFRRGECAGPGTECGVVRKPRGDGDQHVGSLFFTFRESRHDGRALRSDWVKGKTGHAMRVGVA